MKIKLPTWREANEREQRGIANPLEKFISTFEPVAPEDESFRRCLEAALNDVARAVQGQYEHTSKRP